MRLALQMRGSYVGPVCQDLHMAMDWLYGPRTAAGGYEPTKMRNLVLDVEVLGDIRRRAEYVLANAQRHFEEPPSVEITFRLQGEQFTEAAAFALDPIDRDRIELHIEATNSDPSTVRETVSLNVESWTGTVYSAPYGQTAAAQLGNELRNMAVQRLQQAGRPRPSWPHLRIVLAWLAPVVGAVLWVWLAFSAPMPLPAHLLAAIVLGIVVYVVRRWAKTARSAADRAVRSLRYRAFSRETTWRLRADRKANLRIALLSIAGTLAAAVVTAYFTGLFD